MAEVVQSEGAEAAAAGAIVQVAGGGHHPSTVAGTTVAPAGPTLLQAGMDPSQASLYAAQAAAGYYPTLSYAGAAHHQPFGTAAQILNSYQYVMPQAAYPQPTYGWAYYPTGAVPGTAPGTDAAAAGAVAGIAVSPAAKESAAQMSERENKALRRKQANRESARRSKIRKKAESETLGKRAEEMDHESQSLAAEVQRVSSLLADLKAKNAALRQQAGAKGLSLAEFPPVEAGFPPHAAPTPPAPEDGESPASTTPTTCGAQIAGDTTACGTSSLKEEVVPADNALAQGGLIGV